LGHAAAAALHLGDAERAGERHHHHQQRDHEDDPGLVPVVITKAWHESLLDSTLPRLSTANTPADHLRSNAGARVRSNRISDLRSTFSPIASSVAAGCNAACGSHRGGAPTAREIA